MEQEDYIKRQIDQLGRVLGKILADLTGYKARGQAGIGIEATFLALKNQLDFDIDNMISLPSETFIHTLLEGRNMNADSLNSFAEILFILAETTDDTKPGSEKKKKLFERALTIYEYLETSSATYSFDRHSKMGKIQTILLNQLENSKLKTQNSKLKS